MNKKALLLILAGALLVLAPTAPGAQEQKGQPDLRRVADDTKFDQAMQFYTMRDYRRALQEFGEYLEVYQNGVHRNEAYRSIARIYFDRFEYEKSIRAYNAIYEDSANTEEGIEAYYKTGICYQKMGDDVKAQGIYRSIIQDHPYSNFAYLSKIQMDLLKIVSNR
jgi:TolA-binding protein